ncbi:hypothetical protein INT44_008680 [Umbelopsis vinacea]|uniref:Phosphodiesterase n=1 Tax=Umbelopsis vinacea TaxID=44442 RepID=A0A8H7PYN2_9FUNG|nr:hypothetical protein INT44_008680 [Umbelopsis vinacea]
MDSSQCSLILVTAEAPNKDDISLRLLQATFAQVSTTNSLEQAFSSLRDNQSTHPTILLLDLDHQTSLDTLQQLVQLVQKEALDVVPVVCGSNESPQYMLQCLDVGAADYLIKPLCQDVIKTLFLNIHRYHTSKPSPSSLQPCTKLNSENMSPSLQDRLKATFVKDTTWLSEMMIQHYTPAQSFRDPSLLTMSRLTLVGGYSQSTILSSDLEASLRRRLCSWDFLSLDMNDQELIHCVYLIFDQVLSLPELQHLNLTRDQLYDFIQDIYNSYHKSNPYHNFKHAVDVLQSSYYFLCKLGALEPMASNFVRPVRRRMATWHIHQLLRPKDIFALLIASIGHDVGHPGINTSNPLAILYNDRSVLESFHSMALFQIITKHKFVDATQGPEYMQFRKTVVHSILATDMGLHGEYVAKINDLFKRLRTKGLDLTDEAACDQERLIICGALIKCADISNCTRPFMEAKSWAEALVDEFSNQGDLERELGLPVLAVNDRGKVALEDFQLGFIRHVAINLFQSVANVIPEMTYCVDYMQQNAKIWESRKYEGHDSGVGDSQSEKDDVDRLSHVPALEEPVEDNDSNGGSFCRRSSIHRPASAHLMYPDASNPNSRLMVTSPKLYPEYKHPNDHPYIQQSDPVRGYTIVDSPAFTDEDKVSLQNRSIHKSSFSRWRQRRNLDAASCQCCIQ